MARQQLDYQVRIKQALETCVKDGFHVKRGICPEVKRSHLRRSLSLPIKKRQIVSYRTMFKMVYSKWLGEGLGEYFPDASCIWQLYYDLKDKK